MRTLEPKDNTAIDITRYENICANNSTLNEEIMILSEDELLEALFVERTGKRRTYIINRLYSRFSKLRTHRERLELYS